MISYCNQMSAGQNKRQHKGRAAAVGYTVACDMQNSRRRTVEDWTAS